MRRQQKKRQSMDVQKGRVYVVIWKPEKLKWMSKWEFDTIQWFDMMMLMFTENIKYRKTIDGISKVQCSTYQNPQQIQLVFYWFLSYLSAYCLQNICSIVLSKMKLFQNFTLTILSRNHAILNIVRGSTIPSTFLLFLLQNQILIPNFP